MKLRDWVNKNSAVVTILAVLILILSLAAIVWNSTPTSYKPVDMWYYDMGSEAPDHLDRLFAGKGNELPPIASPSGKLNENGEPMGARAWVYSCGDCADKKSRFIAYIEVYSKEAKELFTNPAKVSTSAMPPPLRPEDMLKQEEGHYIKEPDSDKWYQFQSPEGNNIRMKVLEKCGDIKTPPKMCYPGEN
ncbi:MAG: hypothetical protein IT444_03695 [Phycisphaeraceae bacterium]|nr:hypothetical protein [Phycisphaeraceae bacterium]